MNNLFWSSLSNYSSSIGPALVQPLLLLNLLNISVRSNLSNLSNLILKEKKFRLNFDILKWIEKIFATKVGGHVGQTGLKFNNQELISFFRLDRKDFWLDLSWTDIQLRIKNEHN
jgi:hypothetical protein